MWDSPQLGLGACSWHLDRGICIWWRSSYLVCKPSATAVLDVMLNHWSTTLLQADQIVHLAAVALGCRKAGYEVSVVDTIHQLLTLSHFAA